MKIAFVSICGMPWGGSEILWAATAKEALTQGHEVLVSIFEWPQQHPNIQELDALGAKIIYRRKFYPSFPNRLKKKLLNKLRTPNNKVTYHDYLNEFKADHILFNLSGGDEIAQDSTDLMVFVRQTTIPFAVFYHSISLVPTYSETIIKNFILLVDKAKVNLFTSKLQIENLQHQIAHKISKSQIINHPLRVPENKDINLPDDSVINFAMVGSLVCRWKGHDIAIKALAKKQWQKRSWVLNFYGEGDDKDYLIELVKYYNIEDRVIFNGYENDLKKIWEKNHILLAPSRQDSGPIVLFEAMMMGRPVIGSYMGAMPEYIINEETGILAKGISENDFAEALERAWQKRIKWQQWGIIAKNKLENNYDFHPEITLLKILVEP